MSETNPIPVLSELRGTTEVTVASSAPLPPPRPERAIIVASADPVDIPVTGSTPKKPAKEPPKDAKTKTAIVPEVKGSPAKAPQKPATALSALMSAEPSLHMGFSNKPVGDLATNRFTGPAVKPLPVMQ
jgi:hypothetical protein